MLVKVMSGAVQGVNAYPVTIEVDLGGGFGFVLVGLPDSAVKESRERIYPAVRHSGLEFPRPKITINLAPADLKKEGSAYDLGMALGIMACSGQVSPEKLEQHMVLGEISLDGTVGAVKGVLPVAILARKLGFHGIIVPAANADEAAIVADIEVIAVHSLREAVDYLNGRQEISPRTKNTRELFSEAQAGACPDFSDVSGQLMAKRALEIAAAGGHNVLMIGPPGSGKTMLAQRLSGILPPLGLTEALETTKIHSVAGQLGADATLMAHRPFRAPHHTISDVALVGGGGFPQPGEISLAHNGILFLDELPEFKRTALEVLRQPLEERRICISRAKVAVEFPANFMLVAAMNPCPCGFYTHPDRKCNCSPAAVQRYLSRVSGPLMDRIDMHIQVGPVQFDQLFQQDETVVNSAAIRARVLRARERQLQRFTERPTIYSNAMMPPEMSRAVCRLDAPSAAMLRGAMDALGLSARAFDRILKVARTIADLAGMENINEDHVAEAVGYRMLDRPRWAG